MVTKKDEKNFKKVEEFVKNSEGIKANVPSVELEYEMKGKRKNPKHTLDLVYCVMPNGLSGYRIEVCGEELGTIIYSPISKEWKLIQW